MATPKEVLVIGADRLDTQLIEGKQDLSGVDKIDCSGSLFLSPNQELLAICSDSFILIVKMRTLPKMTLEPIENVQKCQKYMWVTDT